MASRRSKVAQTYFNWLCGLVEIGGGRSDHNHRKLAEILHTKRFFWFVPNDDNREEDGRDLRKTFLERRPDIYDLNLKEDCTVLEMLIALSIRMEWILSDGSRDQMPKRFWEMIDNLELSNFLSDDCVIEENIDEIEDIINLFLERKYTETGSGGLFPLKRPKHDQRKIEIWYQMAEYLAENFET